MHQVAEYGVAAHWRYKEGLRQNQKFDAKVAWLRQLMDWQKDVAGGAQEFVDSLKSDIFQDQVYVFTPKGEIKELPSGATSLDFAYRIHTDVGHKCVGAKVNGRLVSLDTRAGQRRHRRDHHRQGLARSVARLAESESRLRASRPTRAKRSASGSAGSSATRTSCAAARWSKRRSSG